MEDQWEPILEVGSPLRNDSHRFLFAGYDSFGFDITEYLLLGDGVESITVIVKDPTENKVYLFVP